MNQNTRRFRHELKYFIHYREYEGLRNRLKTLLAKDSFAAMDGSYHIRSLYFDDMYESALYDKTFGVFRREKYRIRIYNKSDAVIKLERKTKYDQYICKESKILSRSQYEMILKNDVEFLLDTGSSLCRDFYIKVRDSQLKPSVIVDYEREAYVFKYSDVRITFDKMLSAGINSYDIFDKNLVTVNAFKEPVMILEVKYNDFLADSVRDLLQLKSHEFTAASKYVICRVLKQGDSLYE